MFLLVDTQMMMIGKHKYSYNPEDWAFAALSVYTDIIGLFLYALSRLQGKALIRRGHFKTD